MSENSEQASTIQTMRLITGFIASQAIHVASKLGLPDLIEGGLKTVEELANETKTHAPSLRRLLRTVASLGIFAEDADGKFTHTALSLTLRSNDPRSVRGLAVMLALSRSGPRLDTFTKPF